ncbi:MAG: transporter substrate-binding domain-containing protein [Pseudodesulfovibrio sp.]
MLPRLLGLAVLFFLAAGWRPGWCGDDRVVILTSLDWPPYSGPSLPGGGVSGEVVRAAFSRMGYRVDVRYLPWKRAVDQARTDPDVSGFFPEYDSGLRDEGFVYSGAIGASPVGFVEVRDRPVNWDTLEDLARYRVGTVKGYVNTESFDRMAASGAFEVDSSVSDLLNLRKVMAGRVDLAVADVNVFRYLARTDLALSQERHRLRVNPRLLGVNTLHVCFRKGPEGEALLKIFNEGLDRLSVPDMQRRYLESIFAGGR